MLFIVTCKCCLFYDVYAIYCWLCCLLWIVITIYCLLCCLLWIVITIYCRLLCSLLSVVYVVNCSFFNCRPFTLFIGGGF